jgi:hypothetical protein
MQFSFFAGATAEHDVIAFSRDWHVDCLAPHPLDEGWPVAMAKVIEGVRALGLSVAVLVLDCLTKREYAFLVVDELALVVVEEDLLTD